MGFFSHRRRDVEVRPEQKWEFISLNDFKSTSCWTPFAYGSLWLSLLISLAVYAVDIFTAYQLLAFNKWSSQIEPTQIIPFDVSKWIFTVCILLSFANLAYEYFRAITIMRRGSVAECFLDSLAARLESIRMGSGRGWRRFLVFAELTKSKKGAEYIALFTFFSFQSWIRTILCSGPRQVVNALTLYSVYDAKLSIHEDSFESSLASFFDKIGALATEEPRQAVILSGMLFTLVIWIFSFLSLLLAAIFFVFFLWSYIPREDGGLTGFCERKVNKRLKQIVSVKINKAMAEEERQRKKQELKAAKKNGADRPMTMKPSIPVLGGDNLPEMPSLNRADTFASFAEKPSRPSTPGSFEMNALNRKPPMPSRSNTKMTTTSQFSQKTGLLANAAEMGMAGPGSPAPTLPPVELDGYPPTRTATASSNRSYGPGPQLQRIASNGSSLRGGYTASPAMYSSEIMPSLPPPVMSPVGSFNSQRGPGPNQPRLPYPGGNRPPYPGDNRSPYPGENRSPYPGDNQASYQGDTRSPYPGDNRGPYRGDTRSPYPEDNRSPYPGDREPKLPFDDREPKLPFDDREPRLPFEDPSNGRASPAPSTTTYRSNPMSPRGMGPGPAPVPDGYPIRSATNPLSPRGPPNQFPPPARAMTAQPQPMRPFHQATGSNGSQGSVSVGGGAAAGPTYQAYQPYQPRHQQSASGSSLRNMVNAMAYDEEEGAGGFERPSATPNAMAANSEREAVQRRDQDFNFNAGQYERPSQTPNPMAANSERGPARRGNEGYDYSGSEYGFAASSTPAPMAANGQQRDPPRRGTEDTNNSSNGWNQDLERGGPRY